jgi:hypothetical protein
MTAMRVSDRSAGFDSINWAGLDPVWARLSKWLGSRVIYDPGMSRPRLLVWVALTAAFAVALANVTGTRMARAEPPPPCSFALSPPEVVQVSGVNMVTATVAPAACGMPAGPFLSVACLQGADSATQCSQAHGSDTARVYAPYRPGATYTSTGRGLGSWIGQSSPTPDWQILGPDIATL